jgi:potassium-transporting ATPase KdpC subunit
MRRQLGPAIRILLVFTVLLGIIYPLAVTGIAQGLFHHQADGSLISRDGHNVGSKLIGQSFTKRDGSRVVPDLSYFQPRPSAAGSGYDGKASGASNYGPTNPTFLQLVSQRVAQYRRNYGLGPTAKVPVDAVTASGSGLDPDISIANARLQAPRVARERHLPVSQVLRLVNDHVDGRSLGFLGEKGVNVLELNLALDALR